MTVDIAEMKRLVTVGDSREIIRFMANNAKAIVAELEITRKLKITDTPSSRLCIKLTEENARLREALMWYANPENWFAVELEQINNSLYVIVGGDNGAKARKALGDE